MSELARQPNIIPLAYHVDYWNGLGWTDPFSDPAWSKRQEMYAQALPSGQLYTPQLVVNGQSECVGSDKGCIEQAITKAKPFAETLSVEAAVSDGEPPVVQVGVEVTAGALKNKTYRCVAVIVEDGIQTSIKRGENSGQLLMNDAVVRQADTVKLSRSSGALKAHFELKLNKSWNISRMHLIVILQEARTQTIIAASKIPLKVSKLL